MFDGCPKSWFAYSTTGDLLSLFTFALLVEVFERLHCNAVGAWLVLGFRHGRSVWIVICEPPTLRRRYVSFLWGQS